MRKFAIFVICLFSTLTALSGQSAALFRPGNEVSKLPKCIEFPRTHCLPTKVPQRLDAANQRPAPIPKASAYHRVRTAIDLSVPVSFPASR
jgi:hypothetical protein